MVEQVPAPVTDPWLLRAFGLESPRLNPFEKLALSVSLIFTLVAFWVSLQDVSRYAGIDFRNRIVGARTMLAGYDPYTFEWQKDMPLELLDPVHDPQVHRLTATPPTLCLYALIAPLPYKAERFISCLCEWAALLVSIALLARTITDHRQRVVFLVAATLFFVLGDFWRLHVERGQVYAFHLLVLTLASVTCLQRDLNSWAAGVLFGIATLMRPNYLLIAPAFLVLRQWRTGLGAGMTFLLGALATLPLLPPDAWRSYARVGEQYYVTLWAPESLAERPPPDFDVRKQSLEGVDFEQALGGAESTSFAVFYQKLQQAGRLPVVDLGLVSKGIMVLLGLTLLGLLFAKRNEPLPVRLTVALVIVFALDTEYFLPHRWAYVDVVLLLPLALLWPFLWENHLAAAVVLIGLIAGLCLSQQLSLYVATLARSWLVMGCLTVLAVKCWLRHGPGDAAAAGVAGLS